MIEQLIAFSIRWRVLVVILSLAIVVLGGYAALRLPIDAVPDITTNQVQINVLAPAFAPAEVEKYITFPLEVAMGSLPGKDEIRSISKFGLSQVTITFHDEVDLYQARQLVLERLIQAQNELPNGVRPEIAPISTGLGEIYQFSVENDIKSPDRYSLMDLRSILDWQIAPVLRTVPGVIEVNVYGGKLKQYEVLIDPTKLVSYGLALHDVVAALEKNNANVGGAYLERGGEQQLIRGIGLIRNFEDIESIVVSANKGTPVFIRNLGSVGFGSEVRQGAATTDGRGETVLGIAMLLKGENSRQVAGRVHARLEDLRKSMPPGVILRTSYDRSELVNRTIKTASYNLLEGGGIVIVVLLLFLLQIRAGLIVSAAIPFSMLIALAGMWHFGVSANLMSLGAIDFGLIVDAAVILIENSVRRLALERRRLGRPLTEPERLSTIQAGILEVRQASQFGEMIIIASYLPILALAGIEGKMFHPMAFTVILALCGALLLSLTLIPALAALFLRDHAAETTENTVETEEENPVVRALLRPYRSLLEWSLRAPWVPLAGAAGSVALALVLFVNLGSEFIPELDEGAVAISAQRLPSVSLEQGVRSTTQMEIALRGMPEIRTIVSRIGRPEIATDPMGPELTDCYVFLKDPATWPNPKSKEELISEMEHRLEAVPGMAFTFSQPIKFRMLELIGGIGSRSDVAVKIFGEDFEVMEKSAGQIARILRSVPGAADVKVQQIEGLPALEIEADRRAIARHGINVSDVQELTGAAIAGIRATTILEGFKRFDLTVRLTPESRSNAAALGALLVQSPNGAKVPLAQLATLRETEGAAEISRENGQRRVSIESNVRGRDLASFVEEAQHRVDEQVKLPPGYRLEWAGTYENLQAGKLRLAIAVPATFTLIFILLYATFGSIRQALLIFTGIPLALTGGVFALILRGMPFSISAGVGFIAVSGVAVLNGLVLVAFINQLRGEGRAMRDAILDGCVTRLRPVLMTAMVASLGFLPMAISSGAGGEVQRPIATVVIGGLITSTVLTLVVLPVLYRRFSVPIQISE
ncbi:MAG: efflux RND transporter permease subunit [Bryobacterales bacterium]|nr:efflux RND transporter permease subunit [Bryobacterales bacterium]